MTDETQSFEDALADLEAMVAALETGDLALEEAIMMFERGQELVDLCNQRLDDAQLRLEQIQSDGDV